MKLKVFFSKERWYYLLILGPVVSAFLALKFHDFFFKAGVAGSGIVILIFLAWVISSKPKAFWMVPVAFLFSIVGDWFLSNRQDETNMFIAGIAMFFFAHVAYLLFALKNGKLNIPVLITLLAGYLVVFFIWLSPCIEDSVLKGAVLFYLVISCISFSAAAGILKLSTIAKWFFMAGIFSLLFSDTLIAFKEFAGAMELNFLILPTYYLSQIFILLALINVMIPYRWKLHHPGTEIINNKI
jgi:uncharacterized membrane protein YhhN